jgi:hypothetical protein
VPNHDDPFQRHPRGSADNGVSLVQVARAGVMLFGFGITLVGIFLLVSLFNAVFIAVFDDASTLEHVFEKWRGIIIPEGIEPERYDNFFPTTTVLAFMAMSFPVLFLSWLATKILLTGIKVASLKDLHQVRDQELSSRQTE